MAVKILIGADIVPTKSNQGLFCKGDIESLLGEKLARVLRESDFTILNLEVPLTDRVTPIIKAGENFAAPTATIQGLKIINPYFYGIANNHILDQDEQGLRSTIKLLEANGIAHAGAGMTKDEAARPYIKEIAGVKIGIYACAEHEYSIVTDKRAGANPYDPLYSFDHVKELRSRCDLLIVLFHGGKEHYRYPSPDLQRIFHKFSEVGADVVIAQHTHCIGCKEEYNGSMLLYGQGNFLFDDMDIETEKTSLLLQIETNGKQHDYSFLPLQKDGSCVKLAEKRNAEEINKAFNKRSKEICRENFIENSYTEYARTMAGRYLTGIAGGFARILPIRALNKFFKYRIGAKMYNGEKALPLDNYINCEAHRELIQRICEIERGTR